MLFRSTPLLSGDPVKALEVFLFALLGVYALAAAMEGWMEARLSIPMRVLTAAAGVAAVWPSSLMLNLAAGAVILGILLVNIRAERRVPA